jgi:hypothetical protein
LTRPRWVPTGSANSKKAKAGITRVRYRLVSKRTRYPVTWWRSIAPVCEAQVFREEVKLVSAQQGFRCGG